MYIVTNLVHFLFEIFDHMINSCRIRKFGPVWTEKKDQTCEFELIWCHVITNYSNRRKWTKLGTPMYHFSHSSEQFSNWIRIFLFQSFTSLRMYFYFQSTDSFAKFINLITKHSFDWFVEFSLQKMRPSVRKSVLNKPQWLKNSITTVLKESFRAKEESEIYWNSFSDIRQQVWTLI